jgi:DNA (cytosine-5)-methyltransferase 1
MDGHWPAGRGEAQQAWEPPRGLLDVTDRRLRLKALGNAVVPQVAAIIGRRILEIERRACNEVRTSAAA